MAEHINRLEKQGAETNKRLDQIVTILGGIANTLVGQGRELEHHSQILEHHSQLLERHSELLARQGQLLQTLTERFDRFSDMMIIGRTRDTERVGELERRVETLERQVFGGTPPRS